MNHSKKLVGEAIILKKFFIDQKLEQFKRRGAEKSLSPIHGGLVRKGGSRMPGEKGNPRGGLFLVD